MITLPALADSDTRDNRKYRCGWCGHPTDADGNPLAEFDEADYQNAEHVHGMGCCEHEDDYEYENRLWRLRFESES